LPIVYGAGQGKEKIVAKIIEKVKAGQEPDIETDGKFFFAYVEDVVAMIESEVSVLKGNGQVAYTIRDLASGIRKCLKEAR
jgi:nucleoside-diphosphate-sugar epimerase